jgi:glycerophosphoryl diester phosphodiesterase
MQTEIWAHRGASATYIENTLAAFDEAIRVGADGIELDVQRTKDGKLVVFHDENLKRLTNSQQFVWELSWQEIQALTLSTKNKKLNVTNMINTKIPSLEEVLNYINGMGLVVNIELKNSIHPYPNLEQEVADLVQKTKLQEQVLYSSFNHVSMHKMALLVGEKYCGLLTSDIQYNPIDYLKKVGVKAYHPALNSLYSQELVKKCQENHFKVHVWTVDQEAHIYAALLLGVDALITNQPEKALKLRQQFQADGGKKAIESVQTLGLNL